MQESRSTITLGIVVALLFSGCEDPPAAPPDCLDRGLPNDCVEVIATCAREGGVPPLALCEQACQVGAGEVFYCEGTREGRRSVEIREISAGDDQAPGTGPEAPPAGAETGVQGQSYSLEVQRLDCALCEVWEPEEQCVPGLTFCNPSEPTAMLQCDDLGRETASAGGCDEGLVCKEADCPLGRACESTAGCTARICDPGVVACGSPSTDEIEVCDRFGAGWDVVDCADRSQTVRCGPEPLCVGEGLPLCDGDEACGDGARCTTPGNRGEARVCVPTLSEGEPCLQETGANVCAAGLRCLVEYTVPGAAGTGHCRPGCDYAHNDCGGSRACLRAPGGGVCSETVQSRHRAPCATGLAAPCDVGVVVESSPDGCVPVIPPADAEVCDEVDNDCDGTTDEGFALETDRYHCGQCQRVCGRGMECEEGECQCPAGQFDLDGQTVNGCECTLDPAGLDEDGNENRCDGRDNDCNGRADEGFDNDADGFAGTECEDGKPVDCDDEDPAIFPGAPELCDGIDNNCDDRRDEIFDLRRDPDHCGACNRSCRIDNAAAVCIEIVGEGGTADYYCPGECPIGDNDDLPHASCSLVCLPGALNCNGDIRDGCEHTPCLGEPGAIEGEITSYPLPVNGAGFLAWAGPEGGLVSTLEEGALGSSLHLLAREEQQLSLGDAFPTGLLDVQQEFLIAGMSSSGPQITLLDPLHSRLITVSATDLAVHREMSISLAPDGVRWQGLAWDGSAFWIGDGEGGAVFRFALGQAPVQVATAMGPIIALSFAAAEGLLWVATADRVCAHRVDGAVCAACWALPVATDAVGGIAWDGEALWVLDTVELSLLRLPLDVSDLDETPCPSP